MADDGGGGDGARVLSCLLGNHAKGEKTRVRALQSAVDERALRRIERATAGSRRAIEADLVPSPSRSRPASFVRRPAQDDRQPLPTVRAPFPRSTGVSYARPLALMDDHCRPKRASRTDSKHERFHK